MPDQPPTARQTLRLDAGWRFHLGEIDTPLANTHLAAYMANKAGYARGPARTNYDDSDWHVVDLPHDWAIEQPKDPAHHLSQGYLPRGTGWYRRYFRLPATTGPRYRAIRFDGVATDCVVYVNGHLVGRNFCGTTPFTVDITDIARTGDDLNVIAVRVDATRMEGWWYEGAGIYRHVWLIDAPALHIASDSLFVRPQQRAGDDWDAWVELTLENRSEAAWEGDVKLQLVAPDGTSVTQSHHAETIPPRSQTLMRDMLMINTPRLWDLETPSLYTLIARAGEDEQRVRFGFRTIRFDADTGFFLNDRRVLLKGTCNHQDHAGVGAAVPDALHRFRIRRLKSIGINAYRCAHHPPAPELLDACDELGMLVMDENRAFGTSAEHLEQLRTLVRRDRNHPSVILWSLCNEEPIQTTPTSAAIARTVAAAVRELDPSRPITAAVSGGLMNDGCIAETLDVLSINYQLDAYDPYRARHPGQPLLAGETHCAYATRGEYETSAERQVFADRDEQAAPWGATARRTWRHVRERPWVAGLFIWTGFDYHGEPSPHTWPSNSSHWGLFDLCGFEKDAAWLHRAFFDQSEPFVHLLPHWTWPGREGQAIAVSVYSNCPSAELLLNGVSLGRTPVDPVEMAQWSVPYAPGVLIARGYRDGKCIAECQVETTSQPVALALEIHPAATVEPIAADGQHVVPVTVFAIDAKGRRVPAAGHEVHFALTGPARLIGVGNGDPNDVSPEQATTRRLFNGLAQALVQTSCVAGSAQLTARADGLRSATLSITSVPAAIPPAAAPQSPRHWITHWRRSPITATRPDPNQLIADQDMNTWQPIDPAAGVDQSLAGQTGFVLYRATFRPPRILQKHGGAIRLPIAGAAEVFLDGQTCTAAQETRAVPLPAGDDEHVLTVLLTLASAPAGFTAGVEMLPTGADAP